jgi:hypothetical protein
MDSTHISDLRLARFRATDAFDLVLFERLAFGEQAALADLRSDPSFYGVLKPRGADGLTVKAVDRDTALLWLTLKDAGELPSFVWAGDADVAAQGVRQLVLDGILEIELGTAFVSGPGAAAAFSTASASAPAGRIAAMSRAALAYAEQLEIDDLETLAGRLYQFGREPRTATWAAALPDAPAVLRYVGASGDTVLARDLAGEWRMSDASATGWLAWSRARAPASTLAADAPTYKLYVSPTAAHLPAAFAAVARLKPDEPRHFKVGADAVGVLRPDKLVLYFPTLEALHGSASELRRALGGVPGHGVPFSAEIAGDGLLSWGIDPPKAARRISWQEPESWRLWVVRRLAAAMIAARQSKPAGIGPAAFALERLRHEGVDVVGWTPSAALWQHP